MRTFEIVRQRMNRISHTPEPVIERCQAADATIGHDGTLQMIDDGGYVLLAVPKGIWLEVIHIPETADNTQQEAE